jgi:hypothetical protein
MNWIGPRLVGSDPLRIIEAVVTGVSFLGQERFSVAVVSAAWKG